MATFVWRAHVDHQPALVQPVGQRLVHHEMLAFLHGGDRDGGVKMIGRHDLDGVQILHLLQEFAKIGKSGTRFEPFRSPLAGVVGIHDFAAHFAPSGTAAVFSPSWLAQVRPDRVSDVVLSPLHVVVAVGIGVAYRDDLDLRIGEQGAQLPESLGAHADVSQRHLGAGATCAAPPKTWRGTMVMTPDATADPRNLRRLISDVTEGLLYSSELPEPRIVGCDRPAYRAAGQ